MIRFEHQAGYLYLGDAVALLAALPDDSVDLVCTDPPYRVISGGNSSPASTANYGWKSSVLAANDGKIFKHNKIHFSDYMPHLYRVLKPGSHCYVMVNNLNLRDLLNVADSCGFGFHNLLRWDKNTVNANRWYMKDCEYTGFFYKKPARSINRPGDKQGYACKTLRGPEKLHDTQKPVELMAHYITNSTDPGAVVLDPFAGAGSTLVAAAESGRRFIGCEIDPQWYVAAMGRLQRV
jgi:site-specific DNA-methyltransferase (adenine-specific)